MNVLKRIFGKKEGSCCNVKIEEVKSEAARSEELCCTENKKDESKQNCCK